MRIAVDDRRFERVMGTQRGVKRDPDTLDAWEPVMAALAHGLFADPADVNASELDRTAWRTEAEERLADAGTRRPEHFRAAALAALAQLTAFTYPDAPEIPVEAFLGPAQFAALQNATGSDVLTAALVSRGPHFWREAWHGVFELACPSRSDRELNSADRLVARGRLWEVCEQLA